MKLNIFNCKSVSYALLGATLLMASCRVKEKNVVIVPEVKTYGTLTVRMSNEVGGTPITLGSMLYTNSSHNMYSVDMLKYFVTNFTLIKSDNTEHNFGNYKLIDASDTSTCNFTFDSVANGTYKAVRFYLGVDSVHNHTALNEGDLNPSSGMVWTWNTGYIFFKHEGLYKNDTGTSKILLYHYGTDAALTTIDIPVSQFVIDGNKKVLYLKFDLNTLYDAHFPIDFTGNNFHQSTEANDRTWLENMKTNFPSAFTFDKVQ